MSLAHQTLGSQHSAALEASPCWTFGSWDTQRTWSFCISPESCKQGELRNPICAHGTLVFSLSRAETSAEHKPRGHTSGLTFIYSCGCTNWDLRSISFLEQGRSYGYSVSGPFWAPWPSQLRLWLSVVWTDVSYWNLGWRFREIRLHKAKF